jgi:hypothetical protein
MICWGKFFPAFVSASDTPHHDWLNVVDPRIKAKIRAEVREKLTIKQEEARGKLLVLAWTKNSMRLKPPSRTVKPKFLPRQAIRRKSNSLNRLGNTKFKPKLPRR